MTPASNERGGDSSGGAWFRVSSRDDAVVVSIGGEVDMHSSPRMAQTLQAVVPAALCLVIDMTHLSFMDSSGLGVLISVRNRARLLHIPVALVQPPPLVRRLLAGTQLHDSFSIYQSVDEAVAARKGT
jgi:anti-sigma B factor antagonist